MKFKTTLILALVLAVGIVAVVLLNKQEEKKQKAKERASRILNIQQDDVTELLLQPKGIHCVRDSVEWRIINPVRTRGDKNAIESVIGLFERANQERVVSSNPDDYQKFGLAPPSASFILVHASGTDTIYVGDESPTGSFVFARQSGSPDVFLTTTTLKNNAEKELFDLRDKKALGFDKNTIHSLTLNNRHGRFVLKRNAGAWQLVQPGEYETAQSDVRTLVNRLSSENVNEYVNESPESLRAYGLADPSMRVTVTFRNGASKSLMIGNQKGKEYYAKDDTRNPVFVVDTSFVSLFDKSLYDLRNKQLTDFMSNDVQKFSLMFDDMTIECVKDTAGNWFLTKPEERKAKNWKISSITRKAAQLEVARFVDDDPSSLSPYGLDDPEARAVFYNENDQILVELLLGHIRGDQVYAKTAASDAVYMLEESVLNVFTPELNVISETEPVEENN
ncbi:MAG: DUF4340 domain-containing protein [candidate division KSB1 bacterium]|nr:DUF4340 domain-containing protein [candidate division KSB1 bacterium]